MLFVHLCRDYHSKDRKVFLGRASKMEKIINTKNQEYLQIILDKIKGNKKKKKNTIASERVPYVLLLLPT